MSHTSLKLASSIFVAFNRFANSSDMTSPSFLCLPQSYPGQTIATAFLLGFHPRHSHLFLPINHRLEYKLCLLMHKVSVGQAPVYMADRVTACSSCLSLARLRSSSSSDYIIPRTIRKLGKMRSPYLLHHCGTHCLSTSSQSNAQQE